MSKRIIFFDTDQTLWESEGQDYISRVNSNIVRIDSNTIQREKDQKLFKLKNGVREAFKYLNKHKKNIVIGVISDNRPEPVILALKFFGLWSYISKQAVLIKLWNGYCPKTEMVEEVLRKNSQFKRYNPQDIFLIDDKDYTRDLKDLGMNFIRVNLDTNLLNLVKTFI